MPKRSEPAFIQLERQCRLTLTLLPLVSALPFLDDEAIARVFGQAMLILNWIPEAPRLPDRVLPIFPVPRPRTQGRTAGILASKTKRVSGKEGKRGYVTRPFRRSSLERE